jgi:spermidine synthase
MSNEWIELAQQHESTAAFEAAVLARLQHLVGCDVAFLSVRGAEREPAVLGLGPQLVERAVRGMPVYHHELLPVKHTALRARNVAVDTHVLGEQGVRRTAYYRDLARNVGKAHSQLMAYVPLRGEIVALLMLGRASGGFSPGDVRQVEDQLSAIGVARGSYPLPVSFPPLAPAPSVWRRWLPPRGARVRAQRQLGELTLTVRDRAGYRELVAADAAGELIWTRAALQDPARSGWPYIELLHLAAVRARARRRALFIGCGGAVVLRQFASVYPGIQLTLVESEPEVIELAREWYALDAIPSLHVVIAEGAGYVQRAAAGSWDVVVVDAFDASTGGSAWMQPAFVQALQRALTPGGAVAINVIGTLAGAGPVRELVQALSAQLAHVRIVPVLDTEEAYAAESLRNVVVIATRA